MTFVTYAHRSSSAILVSKDRHSGFSHRMTTMVASVLDWLTVHWRVTLSACVLTIAAGCTRCLEKPETRLQRLQQKKQKQLHALAAKISSYGRKVHQRYPTGDVIVSLRDLAEQLGKSPEAVTPALELLLQERTVEKSSLIGYWKLNV
jgi:hypothetical protein